MQEKAISSQLPDGTFTSETAAGIQQSAPSGIGKLQGTRRAAAIFLSRMPDDLEDDDLLEDPPLTPEQEARARQLTAADLRRIDQCLLSHTTHQFHKVARVVLHTMVELRGQFPGLPDVFYAGRIKHLAAKGVIEAAGNLNRMRFSEIRLREGGDA